jgi:hypothetical protein
MGQVIAFRQREPGGRATVERSAAEILFFTGVRYERHDSEAKAPEPNSPDEGRGRGRLGRRRRRG